MSFSPNGTMCGRLQKIDYFKTPKISTCFEKSKTSLENFIHSVFDICVHWKSKKKKNVADPYHDLNDVLFLHVIDATDLGGLSYIHN